MMKLLLVLGCLVVQIEVMAQPSWSVKLRRAVTPKLMTAVTVVTLLSGAALAVHNKVLPDKLEIDFRYDRQQHEPRLQEGELVQAFNDEEEEKILQEWRGVRNNPPPHQRAVFYLIIDGFDIGWRVMHIEYIGDGKRGEPLFVGSRLYLLKGENKQGEPKFVFHWTDISLVGHEGLIKQGVEVEEIAYFEHPYHASYNQTLITIKDVDLSEYEPIKIAAQPEPGTELTMLSYIVRDKDVLHFFDYPLEQRNCRAVDFDAEDMMVVHSCHIPHTYAVAGSPIFAKETLVALYYGRTHEAESYGSALLPELLDYMAKMLDVEAQGKMTTTWGAVKHATMLGGTKK